LKLLISMMKSLSSDVYGTSGRVAEFRKGRREPGGLFAFEALRCLFNEAAAHLVPGQGPGGVR
jgi:hypothetical protein